MNNLCQTKIDCSGTDFPVTNYSSEGGEPILPYLGVVWPPPPPPPPGSGFWATGCIGDCLSYTSQQEADECAQLQAALCDIGPNDGGGGGGTTPITPYYSGEASCTVNCPNGTAFTYYVNAGLFVALTQAQANAIAQAYACEKAQESLVCLGDLQRCWCLGDNRTSTIVPSGGVVVAWVVVSGSLPPGLVFNGGAVSGIPTTGGTYSITIRGYLANGSYAQRTYVLTALNITQTTLPNGTEGANYDQQLTVTGGTAPYTFTLIGGGFPLGVDITSAGLITGVVGEVGVFAPVIQVTDVTGCICSRVFSLTTDSAVDTCGSIANEETVILTESSELLHLLNTLNGVTNCRGFHYEITGNKNDLMIVGSYGANGGWGDTAIMKAVTVVSYDSPSKTVTIEAEDWTPVGSAIIVDGNGEKKTATSYTTTTLVLSAGFSIQPQPGDTLYFTAYWLTNYDWYNPTGNLITLPATGDYVIEIGVYIDPLEEEEFSYRIRCNPPPQVISGTLQLDEYTRMWQTFYGVIATAPGPGSTIRLGSDLIALGLTYGFDFAAAGYAPGLYYYTSLDSTLVANVPSKTYDAAATGNSVSLFNLQAPSDGFTAINTLGASCRFWKTGPLAEGTYALQFKDPNFANNTIVVTRLTP